MLDFERSIWLKILSSQSALWKLYVGNFCQQASALLATYQTTLTSTPTCHHRNGQVSRLKCYKLIPKFWVAEIPSSPIDIPQAFYIRATSDVPIQMSKKRNRTEQKIHAHKSEKIRLSKFYREIESTLFWSKFHHFTSQ